MSSNLLPSNLPAETELVPYDPNFASSAPAAPAPVESAGLPWGRYIAASLRYKWMILALVIVGTAAGTFATRYVKPSYDVKAAVWLAAGARSGVQGGNGPVPSDPSAAAPNWLELMTSRAALDEIARKRRLYVTPADEENRRFFTNFDIDGERLKTGFYQIALSDDGSRYILGTGTLDNGKIKSQTLETGTVGDSIGRKLGFQWAPTREQMLPGRGKTVAFRVVTTHQAGGAILGRMTAKLPRNTTTLELTYSADDPKRAALHLNAVANEFVSFASSLQRRNYDEVAERLRSQRDSSAEVLRQAELQLEQFRVATITKPSEGTALTAGVAATQTPVMTDYFQQKIALENLRADRKRLETLLRDAESGVISSASFVNVGVAQQDNDLKQALNDLTAAESALRSKQQIFLDSADAIKRLRTQIADLKSRQIPQRVLALLNEVTRRERDLDDHISQASAEIREIPGRTIEETRLKREVVAKEAVYTQLLNSYEQMRLQALSMGNTVTVMDTAVAPNSPSADKKSQLIIGSFMLSLGLGIGIALLLDKMDRRFRYLDQATKELGLPVIGAVPTIEYDKHGQQDPEEASQVVEAFRSIRLNLRHAFDGAGSIVLTVTSPGAGDGKSLVSGNLALSFNEAGYRTLLIDGDIRRGELHEMFEVVRRPGLLDYLTGTVPLESILRETQHENLTLVPCGTRRHRGPELLVSQALEAFVEQMKTRYDVIIIDSPPLGAGVDAFVLGAATGNLLMVLRTAQTDRKMAQAKLDLVKRLPIRLLGAVLNDIRAEGAYKYYSYLYGYNMDEEETPTTRQLTSQVGESQGD